MKFRIGWLSRRVLLAAALGCISLSAVGQQDMRSFGNWTYFASDDRGTHVLVQDIATGLLKRNDSVETMVYTCVRTVGCKWGLNVAAPCKYGERASVIFKRGQLDQDTQSMAICGGENPAQPGAFVYMITDKEAVEAQTHKGGDILVGVVAPNGTLAKARVSLSNAEVGATWTYLHAR